ncbi:MAG: ABC transporter permease [Planctomycetes bacterium]|nr:ABC transporter permease [Planctomycetota bacterium]
MYKLLLSLRFFRLRRINLLSVFCIALGVMVLVIVYSVLEGFQERLKDAFRQTIPHVLVERLSPWRRFEDYCAVLRKVPGVTGVAPRVETLGLIGWKNPTGSPNTLATRAGQKGIHVIAIDPRLEDAVTGFRSMLGDLSPGTRHLEVPDPADPFHISDEVRGNRPPGRHGIVVGEELAKVLGLVRGAEVTIFSVRLNTEPKPGEADVAVSNETFYLAGAFRSGMYDENLFTVYIPIEAGRELMERAGYATEQIAVGSADFERAERLREACQKALWEHGFSDERLTTWQDRNRPLLSALVVEKRLLTVLMFFLVLMACGTILAILYMMVLEKRREVGILKALGAPMGGLLQLFLANGGVIGFLGSACGIAAALVFLKHINDIEGFLSHVFGLKVFPKEVYVFDTLPVVYDVPAIAAAGVATILFSLLAALIPAYIAARSDPVRSLRNE